MAETARSESKTRTAFRSANVVFFMPVFYPHRLTRNPRQNGITESDKNCVLSASLCIAIPPKHAVASVIGFLKGKSAIAIARLCGKERNFTSEHFWARGYAVSTVGFELEQVRQYIRAQEDADGADGQF